MSHSIELDKLTLGVCYYPEHWSPDLWHSDLSRMVEHGIEIIRIAEFAWSFFEPDEGQYTFDFFDSFMAVVSQYPIRVIFCTPAATPPAWLTEKYPEVLNADVQGNLYRHGMRRHVNYNSPVFNRFCSQITEQLAKHYGHHPSIIGWQIDNELNCEMNLFYSESDHAAFRLFLQERYGSLDKLNQAWGNVFWNQSYTAWEQVHLTQYTHQGFSNPHLALDEKRFVSESTIRFCKMHSDILRQYIAGRQFITTNGIFKHVDYQDMVSRSLDFMTYDSYPNFGFGRDYEKDGLNDRFWGFKLGLVRSISPVFGVMEQQSGPGGWVNRMLSPSPKPGQVRLWAFQSIAHGADFVSFFRWRTCSFGTEIYWHGLNNYDNLPNRRLEELLTIHHDVRQIEKLNGARYQAKIALLRTYANEWDAEIDVWYGPLIKMSETAWYAAATHSHTPMDVIYLDTEAGLEKLKQYDLLVFPHAAILSENEAGLLSGYVRQGGNLIVGARTGYKDVNGHCPMQAMPGLLREVCGMSVTDFTAIMPTEETVRADLDGQSLEMPSFNDILLAEGPEAQVLARYQGSYYQGQPAVIKNTYGLGQAIYFGAAFTEEAAARLLVELQQAEPYRDLFDLPECCELAVRRKNGENYYFILNFIAEPADLVCKVAMKNLLTGQSAAGKIRMPAFDVLVLQELQ